MLTAVRGLVIRTVNVGEKDKILTLFTEENGLMSVYASGSRVVKSKLLAAADLFCFADYVLYSKGDRYSVREAELIESFYGIRNSIEGLALAGYVAEILSDAPATEFRRKLAEGRLDYPLCRHCNFK